MLHQEVGIPLEGVGYCRYCCCLPCWPGLSHAQLYRELRVRRKRPPHPECCVKPCCDVACCLCGGSDTRIEMRQLELSRAWNSLDVALKLRAETDDEDEGPIAAITSATEQIDTVRRNEGYHQAAWYECFRPHLVPPPPKELLARQIIRAQVEPDTAVVVHLKFVELAGASRRVKLPRFMPISALGHQLQSAAMWPCELPAKGSVRVALAGQDLDFASTLEANDIQQEAVLVVKTMG